MTIWNFEQLRSKLDMRGWEQGHRTLTIDREGFMEFLREVLIQRKFDEDWYLRTYPDVAEAVTQGLLPSGKQHYLIFGYFEGRLPGLAEFDPVK